ncbi:MAG: hypothetical protein GAK31_03444 [Stenotrophomonas maltophilia]|uniref:DUF4785 domain-containing protein n=1 Tax=Stenotrophomonas maltophilia TaxID=40324 RepID=A0A7V8JK43_STEMA|nr:MAG: hypothetical protein GAK31_03444 [Stenotrophomonas maltophilia]
MTIMTMPRRSTLALLLAALLCVPAAQAAQPLLASRSTDQVPAALVAAPLPADGNDERQPLAFAWALDPAQRVDAAVPFTADSRSYWQQVEGSALQQGLELPLTAPDAVVQVSPVQGARALPASQLQVRDPAGRASVARAVGADALRAAGMPVAEGSTLLRTGATASRGAYRLQSSQAQGRYVVQVLEPNSPLRLQVQPGRGPDGSAAAALSACRSTLGGEALLVAPDGRSWPQALRCGADGSLLAQVQVPVGGSNVQGLWELQVFTQADGVLRDARVAFAVARPTALCRPGNAGPAHAPAQPAAAGGRPRPLRGARHAVRHRRRWPAAARGTGPCRGVVRTDRAWRTGAAVRPDSAATWLRRAV